MKNTLRKIFTTLFTLTLIINHAFCQVSISQEDADNINYAAIEQLKALADYIEMIGARQVNDTERRKIIRNNIAEFANISEAIFTNDLDPTGRSRSNFGIQDYFHHISQFYPDSAGVMIRLDSMRYKNEVYYDKKEDIVFSRITVRRSIEGNFHNNGQPIWNKNSKDLDFFIEANLNHIGEDIQIMSMAFYRDDLKLNKVKIDNNKKNLFTNEELVKFRNELDRQKRDAESWKNKAQAAQIRAEAAEEAAKIAQQEARLNKKDLELARRDKAIAKRELHYQKVEAQRDMEDEQRKRQIVEKDRKRWKGQAQNNRIVLKLGGGVAFGVVPDENEEKHGITDEDFIGGLHLAASLNYRLGSVLKLKKANRGTSLSFFYQRDYFNEKTTNYMLNTVDADFVVTGNSTTSEFQGGLVFGQLVRVSAGVGQLIYEASVIRNNTPVEINVKEDYNVYTAGLISPSLKNTVLLYANLKVFHFSPVEQDSYFRTNLEFGLKLQIQ